MPLNVLIGSSRPGDHGPLQAALRRKGIDADVCSDGPTMVAVAADASPDLIVVELHLRGLHGIEVARSLSDRRTSILVDEDEPGIADLERMGLEVLVRPKGGAEGLAHDIDARLRAATQMLEDAHGIEDAAVMRARLLDLVEGDEEQLLRLVLEDPDTHLLSGTFLRKWRLEEEWLRSRGSGSTLSMLAIGFDGGPQSFADRIGMDTLRDAEQRLAGILLTELDGSDLPARDGSGRFLVLMPESAPEEAAERAFEVRKAFSGLEFSGRDGPVRVTLSMGLASAPHAEIESVDDLVQRAEDALSSAERLGAGRVCLWQGVRELREEDYPG